MPATGRCAPVLGDPAVGIVDLLGDGRRQLEGRLTDAVGEVLLYGFELTLFTVEDTDLGRTGEVIQAHGARPLRAGRRAGRARDACWPRCSPTRRSPSTSEPAPKVPPAALRYRELGVWREIITTPAGGSAMAVAARPSVGAPAPHDEDGTGVESTPAGEL